MPTPEAARHDLYNGLVDILGENRADTLMAYLPTYDPSDLLTRSDLTAFRTEVASRFDAIDRRMDALEARLDRFEARLDRFEERFEQLGRRLDRLFLTLAAGLLVFVGGLIATTLV
jgi:hypothetical protein